MTKTILYILFCLMMSGSAFAAKDSLYHSLGELKGITGIVDSFLYELSENDRILHFFEDTNIERFREKLIEQLCHVSGGPCEYTGDDMVTAHKNFDIRDGDFNSLVADLIAAMEAESIPIPAQNDLLKRLIPLYNDIVTH